MASLVKHHAVVGPEEVKNAKKNVLRTEKQAQTLFNQKSSTELKTCSKSDAQ